MPECASGTCCTLTNGVETANMWLVLSIVWFTSLKVHKSIIRSHLHKRRVTIQSSSSLQYIKEKIIKITNEETRQSFRNLSKLNYHTIRSYSSAKYSLLTLLLGIESWLVMLSVVSLTWTGRPYSRSRIQTWHTFFNLEQVWQISVFLYLAARPGRHLNTVKGHVHSLHSLSKFASAYIPNNT